MSCDGDIETNLQEQRDEVLALQSIFSGDDDERLKVLSEATDDASSLFTLMVNICVKPVVEQISVNVILPEKQEEVQGAGAISNAPTLPNNIQLNRTISGARWTGSFEVKYLSPILLYVTFPKSYPSSEPPSFHLSCGWLNAQQGESLGAMLAQLWNDGCSMPILYTWIDWLEHNALDHLGINDLLTVQFSNCQPSSQDVTESENEDDDMQGEIGEIVAAMIQHNREQMDIEFCQNNHECEVCFDEKPGIQFFRIRDCNHKFCHECMVAYCQFHVSQGTVEELRCPDTKCNNLLPPYILQAVLAPAAYEKWEKLLLQKTLDSMSDTAYCPRCQSLVITEEEHLHLAHCTICFFSFCTECSRVWHQGTDCQTDEEVIESLAKKTNRLNAAEERTLNEMLRKLTEESKSKQEMAQNTRNCPNCKIKVEKIGGCNKMTCKCSQHFCWVCGKKIEGYSHFRNGSCVLFPGQTPHPPAQPIRQPPRAVLEMRARIAVNPELENQQGKCPGCKQPNLKLGSNNHMKCWNCKTNFCFLCKQRLWKNIMIHFQGPCYQHS